MVKVALTAFDRRCIPPDGGGPSLAECAAPRAARPDHSSLRGRPAQHRRCEAPARVADDGVQVARPLCARPARWSARRTAPRDTAPDHRRANRGRGGAHAGNHPPRRHALEHPRHGQGERLESYDRPAHLASVRVAAASERDIQAVAGSAADRQSPRHRRAVCQSARACDRALRRRKVADSGAGPDRALAANAARPGRTPDA